MKKSAGPPTRAKALWWRSPADPSRSARPERAAQPPGGSFFILSIPFQARESGWRDLNPRPLAPHASALASCATPRPLGHVWPFDRITLSSPFQWKGGLRASTRMRRPKPSHRLKAFPRPLGIRCSDPRAGAPWIPNTEDCRTSIERSVGRALGSIGPSWPIVKDSSGDGRETAAHRRRALSRPGRQARPTLGEHIEPQKRSTSPGRERRADLVRSNP